MEQITSNDGTVIAFWRSGAGRPLLLVHGTTADHRRWSGILPHLEQHFTVFAIDWEMEGDRLADVLGGSASKDQIREWREKGWL